MYRPCKRSTRTPRPSAYQMAPTHLSLDTLNNAHASVDFLHFFIGKQQK